MSVEPQSRARRKLVAAARRSACILPPALPPAFFVTDPGRTPDPETIANGLPPGFGVVYRHFGAAEKLDVARRLAAVCRVRGLAFLVAADPELAAAVMADGVHWPFRLAHQVRRWRSRFAVQTASAHSGRELRACRTLPVDAVIVSTVFSSNSASAGAPLGALRFRLLAAEAENPVYALGGITAETAGRIAGSAGFAAVEGMRAFAAPEG